MIRNNRTSYKWALFLKCDLLQQFSDRFENTLIQKKSSHDEHGIMALRCIIFLSAFMKTAWTQRLKLRFAYVETKREKLQVFERNWINFRINFKSKICLWINRFSNRKCPFYIILFVTASLIINFSNSVSILKCTSIIFLLPTPYIFNFLADSLHFFSHQ